jgi:transcriptional regulator with XRE-family HTH domain
MSGVSVVDPAAEQRWLAEVGMRVRLGRVERRESQEQLAERVGLSRVSVGSVERADHPASVLAYVRLAKALGIALNELLDGAP